MNHTEAQNKALHAKMGKKESPRVHDVMHTSFEAVGSHELKRRMGFAKKGTQHYQRIADELKKRT